MSHTRFIMCHHPNWSKIFSSFLTFSFFSQIRFANSAAAWHHFRILEIDGSKRISPFCPFQNYIKKCSILIGQNASANEIVQFPVVVGFVVKLFQIFRQFDYFETIRQNGKLSRSEFQIKMIFQGFLYFHKLWPAGLFQMTSLNQKSTKMFEFTKTG